MSRKRAVLLRKGLPILALSTGASARNGAIQHTPPPPGGMKNKCSFRWKFNYRLRFSLSLAALACVLRPTNVLVWMSLASLALLRSTWRKRAILVREALVCG